MSRTQTDADLQELLAEIEDQAPTNGAPRDPERDRRLRHLLHAQGVQMLAGEPQEPDFAEPAFDSLPAGTNLVEIGPQDLTAELLRAAILRHGCLLVRGLVEREEALRLADGIDRSFAARDALAQGESAPEGYYEEFEPEPPHQITEREWVEMGGGVLGIDSPALLADMFAALGRVGFFRVVEAYLGERPMISAQKTTLRKADPSVRGAWHQDGKFLGDIRALNLWLSLSRCGDQSPGLDIVPARIDHIVEAGTDSPFPIEVSDAMVAEAAGDHDVLRPIFEPGDALLFDDLFLHKTGSDPAMPNPRFAIESWFFGPSAYPADYAPLAAPAG
jgi:hypothetical protein